MYRKVLSRLRILVCGGDGTVGWVLASLDALGWASYPPLAILPLGTGNDLARTLNWGGSFPEGEAIPDLLAYCAESAELSYLDRWCVEVAPNEEADWEETPAESAESVVRALPLSVFNNYFSIGADSHVALQFHHFRSPVLQLCYPVEVTGTEPMQVPIRRFSTAASRIASSMAASAAWTFSSGRGRTSRSTSQSLYPSFPQSQLFGTVARL